MRAVDWIKNGCKHGVWMKLSPPQKLAALSALFFGVVVHFDMLVSMGRLTNPDTVTMGSSKHFGWGSAIDQGRWGFAGGAKLLFQSVFLPTMCTLLAITCIAAAAALVVKLIHIDSFMGVALAGCLMASYPALMAVYQFSYYSFFFMLAMLFSVLAVKVAVAFPKWGFLSGAVFLAAASSIYQGYIACAVTLCLLVLIRQLLENKTDLKDTGLLAIRLLCLGVLGLLLYLGLTYLVCQMTGIPLSSYAGASNFGGFFEHNIFLSIRAAVAQTWRVYTGGFVVYMLGGQRLWMIVLLAAAGLGLLLAAIETGVYKSKGKLAALIALCLLVPVGASFLRVILPESPVGSPQALYPYVMLMVCVVAFIERGWLARPKTKGIAGAVTCVAFCYVLFSYWVFDSSVYMALNSTYNTYYTLAQQMLQRMEAHEDYKPGMPIVILGGRDNYNLPNLAYYGTGGIAATHLTWQANAMEGWQNFYEMYLGMNLYMDQNHTYKQVIPEETLAEMPVYPHRDSVQVLEGYMVVRLS